MPFNPFRKPHFFSSLWETPPSNQLPLDDSDYIRHPSNASTNPPRSPHKKPHKGLIPMKHPFRRSVPPPRHIPPLELKPADELKKAEEYLFSAFLDGSAARIDLMQDETLFSIFNVDATLQHAGYVSSRITGIDVPAILGLAPSLQEYHQLWRFRYLLEIQLTYLWGEFQTRFSWAGIREQAIRPASLDDEVKVIRELWCLLRLTQKVLSTVYFRNPVDIKNCREFVKSELVSLDTDIRVYKEKLRVILVRLEEGDCHRVAPGIEVWEQDVFYKRRKKIKVDGMESDSNECWAPLR